MFILAGLCASIWSGCTATVSVRIENLSRHHFSAVRLNDTAFGDVAPGDTSAYRFVSLPFRYGILRMKADGHPINAQTLNFWSSRFTYRVEVKDLSAGHLAIDVRRE